MQCNLVETPSRTKPEVYLFLHAPISGQFCAQLIYRSILVLSIFFVSISSSHAAQNQKNAAQNNANNEVIYFGLLPYLSSAQLLKTWTPLANYLSKTLNKKVIIKTAPNFKTFIERTTAGRYHILMTAPHFAALAVKNNGYRIIAGHNNDLAGDIIVKKNSRFQSISDLRGKTLATPGRLAVVSTLAELLLRKHGLVPNKDITIKISPTHNTALIAVAEGKVDAAVAVGGMYRRINDRKNYSPLRKLASTENVPHVMYIANPSLSDNDFRILQQALTQPIPGSEGATVLTNLRNLYNWGRIVMPAPENLDRLKPVVTLLEEKNKQE